MNDIYKNSHCVKSVQIRSYFWSVFSLNTGKYGPEITPYLDTFHAVTEEYNPNTRHETLIVFDDMIADMLNSKKLNPIVTELFIRGRKLNISLVFISEFYSAVPKNIRLNSTHHFIMKIN